MKRYVVNGIKVWIPIFCGVLFFFSFVALKEGNISKIPSGSIMFFNSKQCPDGWIEFQEARGRYIVGLTEGGVLGAIVGKALLDKENRAVGKHRHTINDPGHSHTIESSGPFDGNIKVVVGGSSKTSETRHTLLAKTNITINEEGSVEGTNAPYIQLLVCQKQ